MHRSTLPLALLALASWVSPTAHASGEVTHCAIGQRELAFTTTQGTITNLDIAPDGRRVVFDLLGDLYVVPMKGGKAVPLTRGMGWDVRPVWSPNGQQVAFISDRAGSDQVFVVDAGGRGPVRQISSVLTSGLEGVIAGAEWTPDSTALVVDGTRLPIDGGATAGSPISVVKGGTYHGNGTVLYHFRPLPRTSSPSGNGYTLWRLDADWRYTGETIREALMPHFEAPLVSRDGRWLVYKGRPPVAETPIPGFTPAEGQAGVDVVRVRDRHTGTTRVLIGPGLSPGWRDNGAGGVFAATGRDALTADSKFLIAAYGGGLHKIDLRTGKNTPIPMSVDVSQCLAPMVQPGIAVDQGPLTVHNLRGTTLRPDGKQLAFSALRRLYVADQPGGKPRVLAPQAAGQFQPAYSPDGKWIAYVSWDETAGGHLWRMPTMGGVPERLTRQAGYYQTPTWSPDGKRIAFVGSDNIATKRSGFNVHVYGGGLQVMSLADRAIHRLPVQARLGHPPSFSGDGRRIWYAPYNGVSEVEVLMHSIDIDGGQPRDEMLSKLLPRGGEAAAVPSPDGRLMALVKHGNLHLVRCAQPIGSEGFNIDACTQVRITRAGAYDPRWRANGRELEWAFADTHYRVNTKDLLAWMASGAQAKLEELVVASTTTQLVVPQRTGRGTAVLTGARIITMRGDEVIENGSVRVEDGRIAQVGRAGDVPIPAGAIVIDLHGKTLLPGFIDAHAHLNDLPRDLLDANYGEALMYPAFGITTAKNPSNGGDHAYTYTELVKAGDMIGPRLFSTVGLVSDYQTIDSFQNALDLARRTQRLGGTYLKYHTGWDRRQRRWIMQAARQTGLGVAAHWAASNYSPGRLNLTTVIDGTATAEHDFGVGRDAFSDVVDFLARSGVSMNFASIAGGGGYPLRYWDEVKDDPRMRRFYIGEEPRQRELPAANEDANGLTALVRPEEGNARLIAAIAHAGGNVTIGSHGDFDGIGFHLEMWAHVRGGMTPHEVLRAATLHGARAVGVEADLGSIEAGKLADLIVLDKNPLDDIRHTLSVERVMQGGILRDARTLDEVWPTPTPLPPWRIKAAQTSQAPAASP